jgi:hypothetical protein
MTTLFFFDVSNNEKYLISMEILREKNVMKKRKNFV